MLVFSKNSNTFEPNSKSRAFILYKPCSLGVKIQDNA